VCVGRSFWSRAGLPVVNVVGVVCLTSGVAALAEVAGDEGGRPDEVVLGFAQVQGEGVVEQPKPGQGFLQSVDGAGGAPSAHSV
jgi:hypothetical protein